MTSALLLALAIGFAQAPPVPRAAAPEFAATRAAAEQARVVLARVAELEQSGSRDAARAELTQLVAALVAADPEHQSVLVSAELARAGERADVLGALKPATTAWRAVLAQREATLDADHADLQRARHELAILVRTQGDLPAARALQESVVAARERALPADHVERAMAQVYLAETLGSAGDLPGAKTRIEAALEVLERTRPVDDFELQKARLKKSAIIRSLGDVAGAQALQEAVLESWSSTRPADDTDLQDARMELAITRLYGSDLPGSKVLFEQALDVFARTLPDDHPYVTITQQGLAVTLYRLGDLAGARALQEKGVAVAERDLPADHPGLQSMRANLAGTIQAQGDLSGARVLLEKVYAVRARILADDHPSVVTGRNNLANVLVQLGDLASARPLQEKVLEVCERTLPADHQNLQGARGNLALTIMTLGDLARARELFAQAMAVNERSLPAEHPLLLQSRNNLASALMQQGDLAGARALQEQVLAIYRRTMPPEHPERLLAHSNLALTLLELDDPEGARVLLEPTLEIQARALPADHPHLQSTKQALSAALERLGRVAEARALQEAVLESYLRTLPEAHVHQQRARAQLAWTLAALGERDASRRHVLELARVRRDAIASARGVLAPRELEEQVANAGTEIGTVLSFALGPGTFPPDAELAREAFSLVESARAVERFSAALSPALRTDPELAGLRVQEKKQSADLVKLAQSGAEIEEIRTAREALDRTRGRRQAILAADPAALATMVEPTVERLSAVLASDQALLGFWRAKRPMIDPTNGAKRPVESMLAFVVRPQSALVLVDLGPIDAIAGLVERWRDAVQARTERGLAGADPEAAERAAGNALRAAAWDPLRPALGDARRVVVALDDALHAVPLEALPDGDGLLGERVSFEHHLSLRELLWPDEPRTGSERFVVLGGANFNAEPEIVDPKEWTRAAVAVAAADEAGAAPARENVPAMLRASPWERGFEPLPQTLTEARGLAALFTQTFEDGGEDSTRVIVLEKRRASRDALTELAPRARFLHLATHGWFASESLASTSDARRSDEKGGGVLSLSQQVRGSSPMVLCGLALAGANRPQDQLGRVNGLITAEEVASLDLSHCELAVLSACDTNVGVRRAGQGVASLQKALHMAGARSVVTSRWKVPDEATKELMLDFYRRLWVEGKPKSTALWEAKMKVRRAQDENGTAKHATRDWAAWVLTGSPD